MRAAPLIGTFIRSTSCCATAKRSGMTLHEPAAPHTARIDPGRRGIACPETSSPLAAENPSTTRSRREWSVLRISSTCANVSGLAFSKPRRAASTLGPSPTISE